MAIAIWQSQNCSPSAGLPNSAVRAQGPEAALHACHQDARGTCCLLSLGRQAPQFTQRRNPFLDSSLVLSYSVPPPGIGCREPP
jgi:hypothetical protein